MPSHADDSDNDSLFAALENETPAPTYTAQRIEQLQAELAARAAQQQLQSPSTSTITTSNNNSQTQPSNPQIQNTLVPTLPNDQSLLDFTTRHPRSIIHFSHPDFSRCAVMEKHIDALAHLHHEVRFASVDVRNVPFVVEKLKVKVLPCVIGFVEGVGVERIVGFEGLGFGGKDADDEFRTRELERRFLKSGVLVKARIGEGDEVGSDPEGEGEEEVRAKKRGMRFGRGIRGRVDKEGDDEDDWD
ncbi:hypothetical protein FQN52_008746 [Onygenales sp. PD_12]|nr:hypothetical protein FQN53_005704 [Emmonsiellopsis sp. PD_33]KAK2785024.1 hypothetical protein FQN52_008746 [Onygenales sp. PD_12]KAK2787532.1 hypothetical protein FQN51_003128 [Onygenales sp. PD_10]